MSTTVGAAAITGGAVIDKRVMLFPMCSATLGIVSVAMQIVAVATPYWAHFKRERYPDSAADGLRTDPLYEEGHYGLWTVCLTVFDGRPLQMEDCITNIAHFHPSSWRIFAGIIATINVVLSLLFLAAIPFQVKHLKTGRPVYCKYKTLTRIQMVLSIVGVTCAILAAVLFGIHSHHKHYKEPKGWSFGLQIIVIVVQVFLLISTSAENVVASRIDRNSPSPQYLFTLPGSKKKKVPDLSKSDSFKYPSLNPTLSITGGQKLRNAIKQQQIISIENGNRPLSQDFSRDNPIFVDSDNDSNYHHETKGGISVIHLPVTVDRLDKTGASVRLHAQDINKSMPRIHNSSGALLIPNELQVAGHGQGTTIGRFRVERIADLFSAPHGQDPVLNTGNNFAYDNRGYHMDSEECLPNVR